MKNYKDTIEKLERYGQNHIRTGSMGTKQDENDRRRER